jgi:glyoxylase I family protein
MRPAAITSPHHMGFSVSDLDRSIRFYCDVLGGALLREPYDGDSPAFSGRMALVAFGIFGLDLFEHAENDRGAFQPFRTGLDHLAFPAQSVEELEQWASWLDNCGVSHSDIRDAGGFGSMFNFADPDGIQLELIFVDLEKVAAAYT